MAVKTYIVVREHIGDRAYSVGEQRSAEEASVRHLIPGVLVEKAEEKRENKAEKKLTNKGVK